MLRFLKYSGVIFLLLLLLFIAAGIGILGTNSGNRWLLKQVLDTTPISIQTVSGNVLQTLSLSGIQYQTEEFSILLDHLHIKWQPGALSYGIIDINTIKAERLVFRLSATAISTEPSSIKLPDIYLPMFVRLQDLQITDILIERNSNIIQFESINASASMIGSRLKLKQLSLKNKYGQLDAQGNMATRMPFALEAHTNWNSDHQMYPELKGSGYFSGNLRSIFFEQRITSPYSIFIRGNFLPGIFDLGNKSPTADIFVTWDTLKLPLNNPSSTIYLNNGRMNLKGWLEHYSLQINTTVQDNLYSHMSIMIDLLADGDITGLKVNALKLHAPAAGAIEALGTLKWSPEPHWDLQLQTDNLNPAALISAWPGAIQFKAHTKGRFSQTQWNGDVHLISLQGTVRDYSLLGTADLHFSKHGWWSNNLKVSLGNNTFELNGGFQNQWRLKWNINAPHLAALWPGLNGKLDASGVFQKHKTQITTTFQAHATTLRYEEYSLETLTLSAKGSSSDGYITMILEDFVFNGSHPHQIKLNLNGTTQQHTLTLEARSPLFAFNARLLGKYFSHIWEANLISAELAPSRHTHWILSQPSLLKAARDYMVVNPICLTSGTSLFCIEARRALDKRISLHANVTGVPLSLLDSYLYHHSRIEGLLDATLDLQIDTDNRVKATAFIRSNQGEILFRQDGGDNEQHSFEHYSWHALNVNISLHNQHWNVTAGVDFVNHGTLSAKLDISPSRQIKGHINVGFNDIALAEIFIPYARDISGSIDIYCELTGSLDKPSALINAVLKDTSLFLPELGIKIEQISLLLNSEDSNTLHIKGSAASGTGQVQLEGSLQYDNNAWFLSSHIQGKNFLLLDLPNVYASISPDLKILAHSRKVDIDGLLVLPEANIKIRNLSQSAVHPSKDTILVGDKEQLQSDGSSGEISINTQIKLVLGDNVHFEGFGFESRLAGALDLKESPGQTSLAYGELSVIDGYYRGYGQKLKIEQGRLLFQGPYDNPAVDVLIRRTTELASASLQISGTLRELRSRIYSVPPLPESEAISILLTGKSLDNATQTDAGFLIDAITSLGLEKGQAVSGKIAKTFKLDTFTINSENDLAQSSLLIGKYLTPRLYVRYTMGLFDQISNFSLDYQLTKLLKLEASSGKNRSVDLIYKIEK